MEKARSRGVAFWGYLLIVWGIGYGLINAARNIWRVDYVGLPIILVLLGIGILNLKNWVRIVLVAFMCLLLFSGIVGLPAFLAAINNLSKEGLFLPAVIAFLSRFIIGISCIVFFLNPAVRNQFKKEGSS